MGEDALPVDNAAVELPVAAVEEIFTEGSTIRLDRSVIQTQAQTTDGLSGASSCKANNDQRQSSLTDEANSDGATKWWHVSDEKIHTLVEDLEKTLQQTAAEEAQRKLHRKQRARVKFDPPPMDDALDTMLKETAEKFRDSEPTSDGQLDKWWKVSDDDIMDMVLKMNTQTAKCSQAESVAPSMKDRGGGNVRSPSNKKHCDRLCIHIFFIESGDTLTLRLPPSTRLGPALPPKPNRFTDVFGQGASTKGFDRHVRSFDYQRKQFGRTQREQWAPQWKTSLKGIVEDLTRIEPARQKFFHRTFPMACDDMTLQSYGLIDGDVLHLQIQKWTPGCGPQRDVVLACTKRKLEMLEQRQGKQAAAGPKYDGYTLRDNKDIRKYNRADGDVWMMPRWISQSCPNLFAPVGAGIDSEGGMKVKKEFGSMPIYLPDSNDSKLARVREAVTGHSNYTPI